MMRDYRKKTIFLSLLIALFLPVAALATHSDDSVGVWDPAILNPLGGSSATDFGAYIVDANSFTDVAPYGDWIVTSPGTYTVDFSIATDTTPVVITCTATPLAPGPVTPECSSGAGEFPAVTAVTATDGGNPGDVDLTTFELVFTVVFPAPENGESMHVNDGPNPTRYVPSTYIHGDIPGPDETKYFPGDYVHAGQAGTYFTRYLPPSFVHNTDPLLGPVTYYLSPDQVHGSVAGPHFTYFFPSGYKHADEAGPQNTYYVPGNFNHVSSTTAQNTYYVGDDWKHVDADSRGVQNSWYVPADWKHANQAGPEYTSYVRPDWIHAHQAGPDYTKYFPPNFGHLATGPRASEYEYRGWFTRHVGDKPGENFQTPGYTTYIPKNYKHWDGDDEFKTNYLPPTWKAKPFFH